ncbi:hypothetical protein NIES4074_41370 [Cylindrospermum sp. NIES-4074]|nr:hypothetical protein NIES4074_41370 [Cylindrospermum sp. NIES-4074]
MSKIFPYFGKFAIASVFISLLMTLDTTVLAQPATAPTPSPSQPAKPTNPISQKLLGQWKAQEPSDPTNLSLIFTPEGKFFLLLPNLDKFVAAEFKYRINPTPQPMHLDVTIPGNPQPVLTIFEFTADGQLRLQLNETDPGKPRPKAFSSTATLFKKVSDSTTLPENTQLTNSDSGDSTRKGTEADAKQIIGAMNRAQQAYYLEYGKFATTINELQIGIKPETENYRYRIVPQGKGNQSIINTATAKKPDLKSYTGIVFVRKVKGQDYDVTNAAICETVKPSTIAPSKPKIPTQESQPVQCPVGSRLLER